MILTCPNCSASFTVNPAAIGPGGRNVRCGKCAHQWHVDPEPGSAAAMQARPAATAGKASAPPPKAPTAPLSRSIGFAMLAGFLVAFPVLTMKISPWIFPPRPAHTETAAAEGIAIDGTPATTIRQQEGRAVLNIEGNLINKSGQRLKVPTLKASALNARSRVVREWTIPLSATQLEAGQRLPFSFSTPLADQGVEDVVFHLL
ncbi:MAG TPA: zinc-ribbon domain-containing protein [Alphaproteobacteria bacterium]|nr:zinc-ribbon domain-containing protein [Alphaproteobacteria bacterium]